MKNIKEFFEWLVFKTPISLVYYCFIIFGMLVTFHQKQSIVDNNNVATFAGLVMFLTICFVLFTFFSVIPEYKKRND
jgi:hypothetical protein